MDRNTLLTTPQDEMATGRIYYSLRGSSGAPFLYGSKSKSRHGQGREVKRLTCWFKHHSFCPRDAWFSRILPEKETEESLSDIIGLKLIEQGVLQALALD